MQLEGVDDRAGQGAVNDIIAKQEPRFAGAHDRFDPFDIRGERLENPIVVLVRQKFDVSISGLGDERDFALVNMRDGKHTDTHISRVIAVRDGDFETLGDLNVEAHRIRLLLEDAYRRVGVGAAIRVCDTI